ncbi:MAG TPA: SDR family NAD(P)-dependent oxidoreductase [Candidatus Binataceae bacterium]|jgi:NAD(P)-dependent dehydrogenase (short-subunit alcohol dehydrogenase family)|nr:SDR family NAD(P)-dependent oxidoreductase [Candidatus Binataceae bacterium]
MEYSGKVAVVTGAGSGIGGGLAGKAGALGMKVVICDVDTKGLKTTEENLSRSGVEVLALETDVTDYNSVAKAAEAAYGRFGRVNLLFNNAGVLVSGISWERSLEDWRWNLDVNVMGVIHGIKAFVPRMVAGGEEGIVVNTASVGGLTAGPFMGPYTTSKYAVVGLTETLNAEFSVLELKLRAACLCPGEVSTKIFRSERIRPQKFGPRAESSRKEDVKLHESLTNFVEGQGITPAELAERVFAALDAGKFWIFPHPKFKDAFTARYNAMMKDEVVPTRLPRNVARS